MAIITLARSIGLLTGAFVPLTLSFILPASASQKAPAPDGKQLFANECAPCHGTHGQGGKAYPSPLTGDLSTGDLASFIARSMPPGPKKCPAAKASKIATYIYDAFYSPIAQARNRPPRIELARLTVRQFKNAVADLVGGFHPAIPETSAHGLRAQYYKGRSRDKGNLVFERVDPEVNFDFGTEAPAKEGFEPRNFSISWQGSVLAPDTGEYEFSIHAKNSCQLWVNNEPAPVVDGEVRSAGDPDPKGTITLIGGRAYSVFMVFTKATQGVSDAGKKNVKPPDSAYVTLKWRRPGHVDEPIPRQFLFPDGMPKTFVVTTHFPPDDRSLGYERGNSVSKEWDDATTSAALETADYVAKHIRDLTGIPDSAKDREPRLKIAAKLFLERAFRRPITDEVEQLYIEKQFRTAPSLEEAMKRVVVMALKSPRFLYREIGPNPEDPYSVASQLSFGLWDTIPDPQLEEAAAKGELKTPDQITAQAERMTRDNRTWSKLRQFLLLWLKVDEVPDIVKNQKQYPDFNDQVASDLRTSLELYLQNTAWSDSSDYRDLMLSDKQFFNGRLAKVYGLTLPPDAPFQPVELDAGQRAGVLTHPYLLSRFAYLDGSDPIHRGVLIERNLLGRTLKPPPSAFAPLAAASYPNMTTRQRVSLQTKPAFCSNCHAIINPLGFTLEKFDAIGRVRESDHGQAVDTSGFYRSRAGTLVKFSGAKEIARYLAESDDARSAFVEKLFLNVAKQPPAAFGPNKLSELEHSFASNQYSIRKLLISMVLATASASKEGTK